MKKESDLNRKFRLAVKRWSSDAGSGFFYSRVENTLSGGFPDTLFSAGRLVLCELKVAGPNAKPDMRPGQPGFGYSVLSSGQPSFILIGHPDGSCRLLWGDCVGDDWRDRLISRFDDVCPLVVDVMGSIDVSESGLS